MGSGSRTNSGLVGCMRDIIVNGERLEPRSVLQSERVVGEVTLDDCRFVDPCLRPNTCEHGGKCSINEDKLICDCTGTGYIGKNCHFAKYRKTCEELALLGEWKIKCPQLSFLECSIIIRLHETGCLFNRHRWQRAFSSSSCAMRISKSRRLHQDNRRTQLTQSNRRAISFRKGLQFYHKIQGIYRRYVAGISFTLFKLQSVHQVRLLQGTVGITFGHVVYKFNQSDR